MGKIKEQLRQHKEVLSFIGFLIVYCAVTRLLHIPCPILWLTGISCPGCGITRAAVSLCRLDIGQALYYNPSVFVVAVAALLMMIFKSPKNRKRILFTGALVMLAIYIFRMFFLHAPVLQFDPANGAVVRFVRFICNNFI